MGGIDDEECAREEMARAEAEWGSEFERRAEDAVCSGAEFVEAATAALGGGLVLTEEQLDDLGPPDPEAIARELFDRYDFATLLRTAQLLLAKLGAKGGGRGTARQLLERFWPDEDGDDRG